MDPPTARIPILVVDDDRDIREALAETLEVYGYDVTQAESGRSALDVLSGPKAISMIITDVRMPDMSGIELAARAEQLRAGVKVILISGFFPPQEVRRRFIRKPFHMRDLVAAVAEELGLDPPP